MEISRDAGSIPAASTSQPVAPQRVVSFESGLAALWQRTDYRNCPSLAASDGELPPHLRYIAERWDNLQPHIREAIITLIDASLSASSSEEAEGGGHERKNPIGPRQLAGLLFSVSPAERGELMQAAVSFKPKARPEVGVAVGVISAVFAEAWEERFQCPVPIRPLRRVVEPPVLIATARMFSKLGFMKKDLEMAAPSATCSII